MELFFLSSTVGLSVTDRLHSSRTLSPLQRPRGGCRRCAKKRARAGLAGLRGKLTADSGGPRDLTQREAEIAAKIAALRRRGKRSSQPSVQSGGGGGLPRKGGPGGRTGAEAPAGGRRAGGTQGPVRSFADLPDWKKEEVLLRQAREAEEFLGTAPGPPAAEPAASYRPSVATWGVFPRPRNISKAYGGGKTVPLGGFPPSDAEAGQPDRDTGAMLRAYHKSRGIDVELEEKHAADIEEALEAAQRLMRAMRPYQAIAALEGVQRYVSPNSLRGGDVYLSLALAYETVGMRGEARTLYEELRRSPYAAIANKAKELLQGFAAMEKLKIKDDAAESGWKTIDFKLPNFAAYTDRRYETVPLTNSSREEPNSSTSEPLSEDDKRMLAGVFVLLFGVPLLGILIALLR